MAWICHPVSGQRSVSWWTGSVSSCRLRGVDFYFFFGFGIDTQLAEGLREAFKGNRENYVLATGAYNLLIGYPNLRRTLEKDILPYLTAHRPGIVSYTATRWTALIRKTKGWPKDGRTPDAGLCYRFVLSNPNVDVCLTAPSNEHQLIENLAALKLGPLNDDEMKFMMQYGDAVYNRHQWFM
jgi:hypothetical protein